MPTYQNDPVVSRNKTGDPEFDGGVYGESSLFNGVRGVTYAPGHGACVGIQENESNQAGPGVYGQSLGTGAWGYGKTWMGVYGRSDSTTGGLGVMGEGNAGVAGVGLTWIGVYGETRGTVNGPSGVLGEGGEGGVGVKGHARGPGVAGVAGYSLTGRGPGIFGQGNPAGQFNGNVVVTGTLDVGVDIRLANADCAEEFELDAEETLVRPGSVVVLSEDGRLAPSCVEYDKRVTGVVSGAGSYRPGLTLDSHTGGGKRVPVALMGKVYCLADATESAIEVGDMLTTSATAGHAMKASDPMRSFGTVIGKALQRLATGQGLVPVLVMLR
ncbi:hypothetical protein [Streptomyces sioyaensis]|uniref:hypothetical protein n=1 Tax=Streptomyces sioyaensis TaxID=67364 RepID=UPI0037B73CC9